MAKWGDHSMTFDLKHIFGYNSRTKGRKVGKLYIFGILMTSRVI